MHVVIFTSPSITTGQFVFDAIKTADTIIAADCGARVALSLGIIPKAVIGDFDSLDDTIIMQLKKNGSHFVTLPSVKDEIDTQLAIDYALQHGATKISLIGG